MRRRPLIAGIALVVLFGTGAAVWTGQYPSSVWESAPPSPGNDQASPPTELDRRLTAEAAPSAPYCENPYETTCAAGARPTRDPTGSVNLEVASEVRALRHLRRILGAHPDWNSKQIEEELARTIYTETRRNRIDSAFTWVRTQILSIINRQPETVFSDSDKSVLRARVEAVILEMPPPASVYADAVDILTKNTLYYERTPQGILRIRVGGAFLMNVSSWFNLVFSLAHEFAHAIDPCELEVARHPLSAYTRLTACFAESGWVEPNEIQCGPKEKVSEVFADWMATEILTSAMATVENQYTIEEKVQAVINSARDLCEDPTAVDTLGFQNHQPPRLRIEKIVGLAPKIRKSLDCQLVRTPVRYCVFEPTPQASPRSSP